MSGEAATNPTKGPMFSASPMTGKKTASSYNTGIETLGQGLMTFAQEQIEETVSMTQQLLNCRTLQDVTTVHSQYMQQSFDRLVKEANKMAQGAASLAKKTASPLNDKLEQLMSKMRTA